MTNKKEVVSEANKKEIFYNIINSLLAGALVFFGSMIDGNITKIGVLAAIMAAAIMAITKFKDYWDSEKSEYCRCLGNFI